jgi:hypothetical protein
MSQKGEKISLKLSDDVYKLVVNYATSNNVNIEDAIVELLRKGYEYYELEKMYDKNIHNREVWDRRFYFLKIESAYLYYRLRLRDIYEEMKSLAMTLSSVVSMLDLTLQRYNINDKNMAEYLKEMHGLVTYYLDNYVFISKKEQTPEINDIDVIHSIEETLEKYKKILKEQHNNSNV